MSNEIGSIENESNKEENESNGENIENDSDDSVKKLDTEKDSNLEEGEEENELDEDQANANPTLEFDVVKEGISLLCKTGNGLEHAYARFDCIGKKIENIDILENYIYLRFIDLSKNKLENISVLKNLTHLITLNVSHNKLVKIPILNLPYLQRANFSHNNIKIVDEPLNYPLLEILDLSNNKIRKIYISETTLLNVHTLELRSNKIKSINGINMPNLRNLFMAANRITLLSGISNMVQLSTLHLRDNAVENLEGSNKILHIAELKKLVLLPALTSLMMMDNPVNDEEDYRLESLILLRKLDRLDKEMYTREERIEAQEIQEQRTAELQKVENETEEAEEQINE
ncbi:Leucine-rich repeat-containing protein 23 [Intoshia linei]|uniref:Leucine-rich repeat-containing protein 23 n=1 Tax=Intoshia linei TaxID=1819745 RepID=A0A177AXR3_9BILA|nr:Leucine-rich repeat-containing protein 23 [Intoshia linei]